MTLTTSQPRPIAAASATMTTTIVVVVVAVVFVIASFVAVVRATLEIFDFEFVAVAVIQTRAARVWLVDFRSLVRQDRWLWLLLGWWKSMIERLCCLFPLLSLLF